MSAEPPAPPGRIEVDYLVRAGAADVESIARAIAREQTIELPEGQVTDPWLVEHVIGRVESIAGEAGAHRVRLSYDAALADAQLPQLLNLLFGNVSLYPGVRLASLRLPDAVLACFPGPRQGVGGLRRLTGVHGRALLATALKPRGTPPETLAAMARDFALGGGDIVKDDQNLVDDLERFKRRVELCQRAVDEANASTGRRCLYLPHVAGPAFDLERRFAFARELGLEGVLACPMIMGLDTMRALAARHELLVMAHPAMAGSYLNGPDHGVEHDVLLGTLLRLAGADVSIFPDAGGRFAFTPEACQAIAARLREPLGALAPAWPCPAGGMQFDGLGRLAEAYGADTVLLVGGALLAHSSDLRRGTAAFADAVRERFDERLEPPGAPVRGERVPPAQRVFVRGPDFEWAGRPGTTYKDAADLAFKGVRRVELVGKHGERTSADLRYFEVEPGGYSSREKHLHTHVIIGARGTGVLLLGNERFVLEETDVAYVEPLEVHQLRNETDRPFGFFCIVDHVRDRPMQP